MSQATTRGTSRLNKPRENQPESGMRLTSQTSRRHGGTLDHPASGPAHLIQVGGSLSGLSNLRLIRRCADLDIDTPQDTTSAAAYTLRLLARRIQTLTDEIRELDHQITTAVTSHTPQLPAGLSRRAWIGLRGHIDHALVAVWSAEKGGVIPHGALGWGSERTSKAGGYEHR